MTTKFNFKVNVTTWPNRIEKFNIDAELADGCRFNCDQRYHEIKLLHNYRDWQYDDFMINSDTDSCFLLLPTKITVSNRQKIEEMVRYVNAVAVLCCDEENIHSESSSWFCFKVPTFKVAPLMLQKLMKSILVSGTIRMDAIVQKINNDGVDPCDDADIDSKTSDVVKINLDIDEVVSSKGNDTTHTIPATEKTTTPSDEVIKINIDKDEVSSQGSDHTDATMATEKALGICDYDPKRNTSCFPPTASCVRLLLLFLITTLLLCMVVLLVCKNKSKL